MTDERKSPLDSALDLVLYAPVGMAVTAAEELPKLAAKGRSRLASQIAMARMVGRFAVAQGRKELNRRLGYTAAPDNGRAQTERPPAGESGGGVGGAGMGGEGGVSAGGVAGSDTHRRARAVGETQRARAAGPAGSEHPASPGGLAIPGYDSLSASQVVQRLAGLAPDELVAVAAYEAAHRGRRTILTRARQLQGRS